MPHTNRARRADHYRSISAVADLSARQNRRHGDNVDRSQEGSDGGISRKGRQSDKWGNDGIAAEPIQQTRFPARSDSRGRGEDNQHALSKSTRKPSTKNQIRSLKRLMNKPVRGKYIANCTRATSSTHDYLRFAVAVQETIRSLSAT